MATATKIVKKTVAKSKPATKKHVAKKAPAKTANKAVDNRLLRHVVSGAPDSQYGKTENKALDKALAAQPPIVSRALPNAKLKMSLTTGKIKIEKAAKPAGESKMDKATAIFIKLTKAGKERKDILASFQADAGLTKAGANTYFSIIRQKHSK